MSTAMPTEVSNSTESVELAVLSSNSSKVSSAQSAVGPMSWTLSEDRQKAFLELRIWADTFEQLMKNRVAIENRVRQSAVFPDIVAELLKALDQQEAMVKKVMRKTLMRAAPEIIVWLKTDAALGLGEHLIARLLGAIGHPRYAQPHHWIGSGAERVLLADAPFERNIGKLWSYCGIGDPSRRRVRGMDQYDAAALGNPKAKMICHLLAISCMRQTGNRTIAGQSNNSTIDIDPYDLRHPAISTSDKDHTGLEINELNVDFTGISSGQSDHTLVANLAPRERLTGSSIPTDSRHELHETQSGLADQSDTFLPVDLNYELLEIHPLPVDDRQEAIKKAQSAPRKRSPFRDVYDYGREKYAERDWSLAHQHNAALRLVKKAIVKEIWIVMDPKTTITEIPKEPCPHCENSYLYLKTHIKSQHKVAV